MWLFQSKAVGGLPQDRLQPKDLTPLAECLQAQSGLPATADACAYDPIQRLLAVSTSDGRVKVIGRDGVERTLYARRSAAPQRTKQLMFLFNRGVIIRLDAAGVLELWTVDAAACLTDDPHLPASTLSVQDDAITCVTPLEQQPYLMLGCASGAVRVAVLINASGAPVMEARQARSLKLMPYLVRPKQLQAVGSVVCVRSSTDTPVVRLLVVHTGSGAAVWDVRPQQLLAVVNTSNSAVPYTRSARGSGNVTAACWLHNPKRGDFATGHEYGDVNIWAMPAGAAGGTPGAAAAGEANLVPTLLVQLQVAPPPCRAIRSLQHVYGKHEQLLVFGGQDQDQPDGLVLLPLPKHNQGAGLEDPATSGDLQQAAQAAARKLPWFGPVLGHALVPPQGALTGFEDPSALLVLQEGGQVVVHDLSPAAAAATAPSSKAQRQQYKPTFQAQPLVTAARLRIIPTGKVPLQGLQGASMSGLRDWTAAQRPTPRNSTGIAAAAAALAAAGHGRVGAAGATPPDAAQQQRLRWQWITEGGKAAKPSSSSSYSLLYCTGHADGRVRLWDMYGEVPLLLGVVPSAAAAAALGSRAEAASVSTLEFAWEQGLLITGHQGGEVRVFQFSAKPRAIECVMFDSVGGANNNATTPIEEPPGFQLRLLSTIHSAHICASTYMPTCKLVAVSDAAGAVSLIDLAKPAIRWMQAPWQQPVAALALGLVPLPPPRERCELVAGAYGELPAGAPVRAVVVVSQDSCLTVLDAATGFPLSKTGPLKPKHASEALTLELLDPSGAPTWMARDVQDLVNLARGHPGRNSLEGGPAGVASAELAQRTGSPPDSRAGSVSPSGGSAVGLPRSRGGSMTAGEAPGGMAALVGGSSGSPNGSPRRNASSVKGQMGGRVGSSSSLAEEGSDNEQELEPGMQLSKSKSRRRQSNSSSSSRPGSPDPKTPRSDKAKGSKSSSRLRSSASSGNLAGEGGPTSAGGAAAPAIVLDDPQAAYVLVATCEYLRLYPISHVVAGDRTVAKRVHLEGPLLFASCFTAAGGPALAALVGQGGEVALQVYTLPGLELVSSGSLTAAAGWPWEWDGRHSAGRLPHVIAATRHGHLALLGPNSELARFALWSRAAAPAPPVSTYDWDMAAAAQAAVTAFEQMKAFSKAQAANNAAAKGAGAAAAADPAGKPAAQTQQAGVQEAGEEGGEGGGGGRRGGVQMPKDFKGFMTKIGQDFQRAGGEVAKGFQKALDETQKGLQKVAQVFEEDLSGPNRPNAKGLPKEDASYPHPTLAALFDCTTPGTLHLRTAAAAAAATSSTSELDEESPRGAVPTDFTSGSSTNPISKVRSARQSLSPRSTRRTTEMVPAGAAATAAAASGLTAGGGSSSSAPAGRSSKLLGGDTDAARAALFEGAGASSSATRLQPGGSSNSSGATAARLGASGAGRGAAAAGGGATKVRTAEEIRQAYGRAPLQKSYEIRNVMEENQQKLAERGEKLSRLQDKAGDLSETAAGFAEMAKLLAEREKQKTRWF